jgi:glutaredoxin-like protein NrdH
MKIQVHTIAYDVINLEQHPELVEQLKELGLTQAPIVTTEGFSFTGFRPDKIKELERRYRREKPDA